VKRDLEDWLLATSRKGKEIEIHNAGKMTFSSSADVQAYIDGPFKGLPEKVIKYEIDLNLPGGGFSSTSGIKSKDDFLKDLQSILNQQFALGRGGTSSQTTNSIQNFRGHASRQWFRTKDRSLSNLPFISVGFLRSQIFSKEAFQIIPFEVRTFLFILLPEVSEQEKKRAQKDNRKHRRNDQCRERTCAS
jgi:hypothetical protein